MEKTINTNTETSTGAGMQSGQVFTNFLNMAQEKDKLPWQPFSADQRSQVGIIRLFETEHDGQRGPAAALLRYYPGARGACHLHTGNELIYVLDGVLHTSTGTHRAGTLEVCRPGSMHEPWSDEGCVLLVVWERPVVVQKQPVVAENPALADAQ